VGLDVQAGQYATELGGGDADVGHGRRQLPPLGNVVLSHAQALGDLAIGNAFAGHQDDLRPPDQALRCPVCPDQSLELLPLGDADDKGRNPLYAAPPH